MVNLEQLTVRGLRAYEYGRLRMASRVGIALAPAALVCLLEAPTRQSCACLVALLLGLSVWLRWRDRTGSQAVTSGLLAGGMPLVAGLLLSHFDVRCASPENAPICAAFSALIGVAAGVVVALREVRQRGRFGSLAAAASVSVLAASLGCLRLGMASVLSVTAGIAVGAALTPTRRESS